MQKKALPNDYLSGFCMELALLLKAGITAADGISVLEEDFSDKRGFLSTLHGFMDNGSTLHDALSQTGRVPAYLLDMVLLGERSGRLEDTLFSLSKFYKQRAEMSSALRSAVVYPLVLLIMLVAVVGVLITQVLPIFAEVFAQMGAEMSPMALWLMDFGQKLSSGSATVVWVLIGLAAVGFIIYLVPALRSFAAAIFRRYFGAMGVFHESMCARFSSAMTTAIASGLSADEAVELASRTISGVRRTDRGLERCREMLAQGESLEKSLANSGVFSARDSRLFALGVRTGMADSVMGEIARRSEESSLENIDSAISKIEPAMVLIIAAIIGAVLLSVMLPLMGIMSALG